MEDNLQGSLEFCISCEQTAFVLDYLFKDVCIAKRESVFYWRKDQACLLFNVIKIMSFPGEEGRFSYYSLQKINILQVPGPAPATQSIVCSSTHLSPSVLLRWELEARKTGTNILILALLVVP